MGAFIPLNPCKTGKFRSTGASAPPRVGRGGQDGRGRRQNTYEWGRCGPSTLIEFAGPGSP